MKKRMLFSVALCVLVLLTFSFAACDKPNGPSDETPAVTDAPTDPATETPTEPATEAPTDPVTEEPTEAPTETPTEPETEPETEPIDGIFEDPAHMDLFLEEKNGSYITGKGCTITFNEDGTFTLLPKWKVGDTIEATMTIKYAKMMSTCYPGFTKNAALPNGGEEKMTALVLTVRRDAVEAEFADMEFAVGRTNAILNMVSPVVSARGTGEIEYLIYDMAGTEFVDSYANTLRLVWACGIGTEENLKSSLTVCAIDLYPDLAAAMAATGAQPDDPNSRGHFPAGVSDSGLTEIMASMFKDNVMMGETVMFLDPGDEKQLLFDIDEIISVTSYNGRTVYQQGKDYDVVDGKLVLLEGSAIPHIGSDRFYNNPGSIISVMHNGKQCPMYWGEATAMTQWQIVVNYTHNDTWDGYFQPCEAEVYKDFITKLLNGEDVTVMFYGDSITYGANASFLVGGGTNQHTYSQLVVETLADLYHYKVHYVKTGLSGTANVPSDYGTGTRGTITYINTAVGGWTSGDGVSNYNNYVQKWLEQYGCDLFLIAYGMNDGGSDPTEVTLHNTETVLNKVIETCPECALMMISTMVPNPDGIGWYANQVYQEAPMIRSARVYRAKGIPCAVACMGSTSRAVLTRKQFMDYTGNNVNHPNDFFSRVYAQTIFQTLIGYDNLGVMN